MTLAMKRIFAICAVAASVSACTGTSALMAPFGRAGAQKPAVRSHLVNPLIQHVVIIVQENRSMDNLFNGFPGADTVRTGRRSNGSIVALAPVGLISGDIGHGHSDFLASYDGGRVDGFDLEKYDRSKGATLPYSYVPQSNVQPSWQLAAQYVLADRMFQSNAGPSFPSHQYLIAGQSDNAEANPAGNIWGCDSPANTRVAQRGPDGKLVKGGIFPCFNYQTMADLIDAGAFSWRYYAPAVGASGGAWSAYDAVSQIRYGAD